MHWIPSLRTRAWPVLFVAGALEAALALSFDARDARYPGLAAALGILIAVLAGALTGPFVGAVTAAIGWALYFAVVVDTALRAVAALPAWIAAAALAGLLADRLRAAKCERNLVVRELGAVRDSASEAIVGLRPDGTIASWSSGAKALYGYDADEVVGASASLLVPESGAAELGEAVERARRGEGTERAVTTHRRKGGVDVAVSLAVAPVWRDGEDAPSALLIASDVSGATRLAEQLGDAEWRYRALVESLPLVTYRHAYGDRSALEYVSPQIEDLLGYSPEEWLAGSDLFSRVLHPADRGRVLVEVAAASKSGNRFRAEYRMLSRGGDIVFVRDEATVVRDAAGQPLYMQGYLVDLSERKRAEEQRARLETAEKAALSASVRKQRRIDLLASAGDVLASSLDVDTTLRRLAELAVRDFADWCVVDLVDEEGAPQRIAAAHAEPLTPAEARAHAPRPEPEPRVLAVVRTGRAEMGPTAADGEAEGRTGDGAARGSYICVPMLARGRLVGALTFVSVAAGRTYRTEDLTLAEDLARRAALAIENARMYREVEQRADAARVLTYVADAVFLVDRTGVVRLWNPAAETITGLPASSVVGRTASEAIPDWQRVRERIPVVSSPAPAHAATVPLETETGEKWISMSGVDFFGGTVYAFRDVTDERRLDELKTDFVTTASHELRTPLAAVYGAAQTLRRHDFALDEAGRERFVSMIVDESERLSRIVNEILLASQLDAGRLDLAAEPFDPCELLDRVVESEGLQLPPGISLEAVAPPTAPMVAADRDQVRQVLVNLVQNAIKYSPDGGRIEVGITLHDSAIRFHVKDEGLGIPAHERERIFEKFYRLDPAMMRGVGGTGLGLYICSELVARMGGRIWVDSEEGKGSTFFFELPLTDAGPIAGAEAERREAAAAGGGA